MAWTWVVEDFNRSDRPLHGDNVGASSLTWASYRNGSSGTQAKIQSNAPVPISSGAGSLLTDVEPLAAGSPILGVGVEVTMLAPGTRNMSLHAAIPPVPGGEAIWFHTFNTTGSIYSLPNLRLSLGGGPSVGWIAAKGVPTSNGQSDDGSRIAGPDSAASATTGDVLRLEVVFGGGGSAAVYKNGALVLSVATPGGLDASHTLVGAVVNDLWPSDNWRVGVLT